MKRYWKIISISLVTLIVIGTFYIQSSFATNEHVKIEFEKINGNEDEVKDLILYGDYLVGHFYNSLKITSEETSDQNNLSFLQRLERLNVPPSLEELVATYKNFMRGKDLSPYYFFEDENLLAYASIKADNFYEQPMKNLTFDIEVIDKKSKEITSIELDVPERKIYNWMHVENVQVINGELKVITQGYRMDNTDELRIYTIDMKEQKLVNDESIASVSTVENRWSQLRIINHEELLQGQKSLLIQIETFEEETLQRDGRVNLVANEYIVYDIENNESKKIIVPDELLEFIEGATTIVDSTIYLSSWSANGLEVNEYDIVDDKWGEKLTVALEDMKDDEAPHMKMMNGKLIVVYATNDGHTLMIVDLHTGKTSYEGKLHVKNQEENQKDYRLYIHEAAFAR